MSEFIRSSPFKVVTFSTADTAPPKTIPNNKLNINIENIENRLINPPPI
ncbi:hypothetical protein [Methanobacterium sp. CWC-01]|nr:hypothetical protein [Methanobacterium sp. CWC-01]